MQDRSYNKETKTLLGQSWRFRCVHLNIFYKRKINLTANTMNRRDSLKALGLIAAGSAAVISTTSWDNNNMPTSVENAAGEKLPGVQDFEHARTQRLYKEQYFNEHEMATIAVLADIIIPKDDSSPSATEVGVPE